MRLRSRYLSPIRVSWRLRSTSAGQTGAPTSPVWELSVGHGSGLTGEQGFLTPKLDVNNDGFADTILFQSTGQFSTTLDVFYGSATGLPSAPATPVGTTQIEASLNAGDVNGDGFSDVILVEQPTGQPPAANLFLGSAGGLGSSPNATISTQPTLSAGGVEITEAACDVNGDGYSDVLIAQRNAGYADLYLGGATGLAFAPSQVPGPNGYLGYVSCPGDVNGDGFADVAAAGDNASESTFLYLGSSMGLGAMPLTVPATTGIPGGDINGDGYGDFIDGLNVYLGGPNGPTAPQAVSQPAGAKIGDYPRLSPIGDVNGDGFSDLLLGEGWNTVYIFFGSAKGPSSTPANTITTTLGASTADPSYLGFGLSYGDINGDGFGDAVITDFAQSGPNSSLVFFGSTSGLPTSPADTLTGTIVGW